jgi:hypothetical protein
MWYTVAKADRKAETELVYSFVIEPGLFFTFDSEAEELDRCKEWGLLSDKASKTKTFYYKGHGLNEACRIVGFVDKMTAVIEFGNKQKHCIHPSYLKEMQASNYGQRYAAKTESGEEAAEAGLTPEAIEEAPPALEPAAEEPALQEPKEQAPAAGAPAKKGKTKKIELPEEKVKMVATVKEFTTVPNHFSDNDDEVIIYEAVSIVDTETELGAAWSSHSATLKKLELAVGDTIAFEAKVIAKKLTKHPVPYKINNPAKIRKEDS